MASQRLWVGLLLAAWCAAQETAEMTLPPPVRYVADYADVVDDGQEGELNGRLQELETATGIPYVILTVRDTKGISLARFAARTAVSWKLRQKGKDTGVLLVLVTEGNAYRFEVGQDLRGILTDEYLAQIGEGLLRPRLQAGRASDGLYDCTLHAIRQIASGRGVVLTGSLDPLRQVNTETPRDPGRSWVGWCGLMVMIGAMVALVAWLGPSFRRSVRSPCAVPELAGHRGHERVGERCNGFGGGFGAFGAGTGYSTPLQRTGSH